MLTQQRLKELLYYHPESGDFVWISKTGRSTPVGKQAGTLSQKGYVGIRIEGHYYLAHRLAVFYVTGAWPSDEVDHKDTVKHHNWWANLRDATRRQNACNTKLNSTNTSGFKNISWDKRRQMWQVRMRVNKTMRNFGNYTNITDACEACTQARERFHGEFARNC